MQDIAEIICSLVDVSPDSEGNIYIIVKIRNKRYAENMVKILRKYKKEDVILKIKKMGI